MAQDLLELLDALEIERPIIVGHSYGADIALYFAARHPERVARGDRDRVRAAGAGGRRRRRGLGRLVLLVRALEQAGHAVPADSRSDLRYLIRATIDLPKQWGPLRGLPAQPQAAAAPAGRDVAAGGLPPGRQPAAGAHRGDPARRSTLMYAERSAFLDTFDYLDDAPPDAHPVLLPAAPSGATSARSSSPSSSPTRSCARLLADPRSRKASVMIPDARRTAAGRARRATP